jgi:predicted CoA-binding protein
MTDQEIADLLRAARVVAVVGLSPRPERPSNQVAWYLQRQGYRLYGVNPNCDGPVDGVPVFADLASVPEPIDLVVVFRRAARTPEVARAAVAVGAKALWLQLGIRNAEAAAIAAGAGLAYVENRCVKVDHGTLLGSAA